MWSWAFLYELFPVCPHLQSFLCKPRDSNQTHLLQWSPHWSLWLPQHTAPSLQPQSIAGTWNTHRTSLREQIIGSEDECRSHFTVNKTVTWSEVSSNTLTFSNVAHVPHQKFLGHFSCTAGYDAEAQTTYKLKHTVNFLPQSQVGGGWIKREVGRRIGAVLLSFHPTNVTKKDLSRKAKLLNYLSILAHV